MLRRSALLFFACSLVLQGCQDASRTNWRPLAPPTMENHEHDVFIPADEDLVGTLRVALLYNDEAIQVRYEFATAHPSWYHDYLLYRDGAWHTLGGDPAGPHPEGFYEDRISMAMDDGRVEGFDTLGGFVTMHPGVVSRTDATAEEHTKFLRPTREGGYDSTMARRTRGEGELLAMREVGAFLMTWQWRAHRSNPIGFADPGYVLDARHATDGTTMFDTNWDSEKSRPRYMFNPERVGIRALRHDRLLARAYTQDDPYFLSMDDAVAFDPSHEWRDGDVIPRRFLREPSGGQSSLRAEGRWRDGAWRVRVTRQLEAPDPMNSKSFREGETYHVAFAVHRGATQGRWHLVSMPLSLGLGDVSGVDITAKRVAGSLDEARAEWTSVPLFYAGQVTYEWMGLDGHPVHRAYAAALAEPLDPGAIRGLARRLAEHEAQWLAARGIRNEGR